MMHNIINFLRNPWQWYKERKEFKRKLAELRERDPYIYK